MAIDLDTDPTGYFVRAGKIAYALRLAQTFRGETNAADTLMKELGDAIAKLDAATPDVRGTVVPALLNALASGRSGLAGVPSACRAAAQALLIKMVQDDNRQPVADLETANRELDRQMRQATTRYVDANTVSATATQTGLDGNGHVVTSVKDAYGNPLENLLAEDLECEVTNVATAGSESIRVRGEAAVDRLHYDWPKGSGGDKPYTAIDAAATTQNKLTDGGFETWASSPLALTNWPIVVGAYGTNFVREATEKYKGTYGVAIVGDAGLTLSQFRQDITSKLDARKQYGIAFPMKRDGVAAAAGVLTVDLFDGTNVINDDAGTANSFTVDLTALTTSFVWKSGVFRIPEPKPSTIYLRFRLSTALTNGRTVYLDHASLGEMLQVLTSEPGWTPFLSFHSGSSNWSRDDKTALARVFRIASANNRASEWQKEGDRLLDTAKYGITWATAGTTLVNDNLIA